MKFKETLFDKFLTSNKKINLHPELKEVFEKQPQDINDFNNIIIYGPSGSGKYTQALKILSKYSSLKYETKMVITFNKQPFYFKISDIHIEVDIELLGCNSKLLWNSIYEQINDVAASKPNNNYIIVCKNFHKINSELLEYFYSYMQTPLFSSVKLKYILITEQLSFISYNILSRCKIIYLKKPAKSKQNTISKFKNPETCINLKSNDVYSVKLENVNLNFASNLLKIINNKDIDLFDLRDTLYKLLVYNLDIFEIIW